MSVRGKYRWAAALSLSVLWNCAGAPDGSPSSGRAGMAPATLPPTTAGCGPGSSYCVAYDFTAGDTCGACDLRGSPACVAPAYEVITWQHATAGAAPVLQSDGWDCYAESSGSVCYLNHECLPSGKPDAFTMTCENEQTHVPAPAPLQCETTAFGAELSMVPQTNLGFWPFEQDASLFAPGSPVSVKAVAWLPAGMALIVGLDCGQDAQLSDRQGQSGPRIHGSGGWVVAEQSFVFARDHAYCSGWGQVLDAGENPPNDGEGHAGNVWIASYSVSGTQVTK